jgi:hypothetical protein
MGGFFSCNPFFILALAWAGLYGIGCFTIFIWPNKAEGGQEVKTSEMLKRKKLIWVIHQIWFNALGAFIGWIAIYYLFQSDVAHFGAAQFIALIIGFLGITGNLPFAALMGK